MTPIRFQSVRTADVSFRVVQADHTVVCVCDLCVCVSGQVRPFAIRDLSLEAMSGIDPHSPTLQDDVTKWLESQVGRLMCQTEPSQAGLSCVILCFSTQVDDMISHTSTTPREDLAKPPLPLIRIRVRDGLRAAFFHMVSDSLNSTIIAQVDPTGYGGLLSLSNARFGLRFVGRVANPRDILLLQRPRKPRLEPRA